MARTRAQDKAGDPNKATAQTSSSSKTKPPSRKRAKPGDTVKDQEDVNQQLKENQAQDGSKSPVSKSAKKDRAKSDNPKLDRLLSAHGNFPLQDSSLKDPQSATAATVLAHVYYAHLTSARISHQIAEKTLRILLENDYANLSTLENSTWERLTELLTEGGYTRYREKTATELQGLAELVRDKYDGDLNNLLAQAKKKGGSDASKVRAAVCEGIKQIKGIGDVALQVFCDRIQGLWPELGPFISSRSQETAKTLGLPTDAAELFDSVGKAPVNMSRLMVALTTVRLEKLIDQFKQ